MVEGPTPDLSPFARCCSQQKRYASFMLTVEPMTQIAVDDRGVAWIADTNTKVKEVVLDQVTHSWDAEQIHQQHPHLSLGRIHAALAYYYEHKEAIDAQIQADLREYERLRAEAKEQVTRAELRGRLPRK
jgi:uncharacterized protein (DUF433 family)